MPRPAAGTGAPAVGRYDQPVAARTKLLDQFAFVVEAERLRPAQNRNRDAQHEPLIGGQPREPASRNAEANPFSATSSISGRYASASRRSRAAGPMS